MPHNTLAPYLQKKETPLRMHPYPTHLFAPRVQPDGTNSRQVDAQSSVHSRALDAEVDANADGRPLGVFWRERGET